MKRVKASSLKITKPKPSFMVVAPKEFNVSSQRMGGIDLINYIVPLCQAGGSVKVSKVVTKGDQITSARLTFKDGTGSEVKTDLELVDVARSPRFAGVYDATRDVPFPEIPYRERR